MAWGHLDSDVLFELFPMFLCKRHRERGVGGGRGGGDRQTERKGELVVTAQSTMTVIFILVPNLLARENNNNNNNTQKCVCSQRLIDTVHTSLRYIYLFKQTTSRQDNRTSD